MRAIIIGPVTAAIFLAADIATAGAQMQGGVPSIGPDRSLAQNGQGRPNIPGGNGTSVPQQPPQSGSSGAPGSLSQELNRSGGVIYPPPTGDRGVVSPPNQRTSRTPVIPPPGTPGGNPEVQPK
jgi:hypothetical protein